MGIQVGVEPNKTDCALLRDGLGSTLPSPNGTAMVTSKHQRLVASAEAFSNRCRDAFRVMSSDCGG